MFVSSPGRYYPGTGVEGTWLVAEVGATAVSWSSSEASAVWGQHQARDVWWQCRQRGPGGMSPRGDNLDTRTRRGCVLCAKCCHQMSDAGCSCGPGPGLSCDCRVWPPLTGRLRTAVSRCSSQGDNEGWLQWDLRHDCVTIREVVTAG